MFKKAFRIHNVTMLQLREIANKEYMSLSNIIRRELDLNDIDPNIELIYLSKFNIMGKYNYNTFINFDDSMKNNLSSKKIRSAIYNIILKDIEK